MFRLIFPFLLASFCHIIVFSLPHGAEKSLPPKMEGRRPVTVTLARQDQKQGAEANAQSSRQAAEEPPRRQQEKKGPPPNRKPEEVAPRRLETPPPSEQPLVHIAPRKKKRSGRPAPPPQRQKVSRHLQKADAVKHPVEIPKAADNEQAEPKNKTAAAQAVVVAAKPRYSTNPQPHYPKIARRRGWQGTTKLAVTVNSEGEVEKLAVRQSSGYTLLDQAALEAVRDWLFNPGRKAGKAVTMEVVVPIRFTLR